MRFVTSEIDLPCGHEVYSVSYVITEYREYSYAEFSCNECRSVKEVPLTELNLYPMIDTDELTFDIPVQGG